MEAVQEEHVALQAHEARLGRIEALLERNLARQETIASDIQIANIKADNLREITLMTNKRIDFFRGIRSDTVALWVIAAALWVCAIKMLLM